jgi:hypothetical protein
VQDLKKARWYLDYLIKELDKWPQYMMLVATIVN